MFTLDQILAVLNQYQHADEDATDHPYDTWNRAQNDLLETLREDFIAQQLAATSGTQKCESCRVPDHEVCWTFHPEVDCSCCQFTVAALAEDA